MSIPVFANIMPASTFLSGDPEHAINPAEVREGFSKQKLVGSLSYKSQKYQLHQLRSALGSFLRRT